ncbi:hypothetical protein KBB76_01965 [Candidatus Saccharibacteria bacterium]|jgi:hypothetical protein|nr:hypothetical protein [Candidatus Saccharibacteria bacterium]HOR23555.1 hypothetical protein [Candidatus Saccharibacteria bacterium]
MKEKEIKIVPIEVIEGRSQEVNVRLGRKALVGSSNLPYGVKVSPDRKNGFRKGDQVRILPKVNDAANELAA